MFHNRTLWTHVVYLSVLFLLFCWTCWTQKSYITLHTHDWRWKYIAYIFSIPRFWLQKKKIQAIGFMIQLCIHRGAVNTFLVLVFINEWPPQLMRFMKTGFDSCSRRSMWLLFVLFHVLFFIHFHAVLNRHTTPNSFSLNVYAAMCSSCVSMLL